MSSKGRGGALKELLKKHKEQTEQALGAGVVGVVGDPEKELPKSRGRAALLEKLRLQREAKVGAGGDAQILAETPLLASAPEPSTSVRSGPSSSRVEEVTRKTEALSIASSTEREPCQFRGTAGQPLRASANYIQLEVAKDRGVFEYEVRFQPDLDARSHRIRVLNDVLGEMSTTKVFDGGSCLYLPQQMYVEPTEFVKTVPNTEQQVTVTLIYKRKRRLSECLHLYNVLFKRIMNILLYTRMGKNYFSPDHKHLIPLHRLEVYPGYAVSVDEMEAGPMVCLDTQHRVIRSQTVHQLLQELYAANPREFRAFACTNIIDSCILTKYNNQTHTITDIGWDMSPKDTFSGRNGETISFIDYYKRNYNIDIHDLDQPMLISRRSKNVQGKKEDIMVCLVPELSYLTGLTDAMRNDFKVMKDVAVFTRITPNQRVLAMRSYLEKVNQSEKCQQVLGGWGLKIASGTTSIDARVLPPETIYLGGGGPKDHPFTGADWNRAIIDNKITGPVDFQAWQIYFSRRDQKVAKDFIDMLLRLAKGIGCVIREPQQVVLEDVRTETYKNALIQKVHKNLQFAVFVFPAQRADLYSVIKTILTTQMPIASQVVLSRNLSNPQKMRTIVHKIALQITAKLGGHLWTVPVPFTGWMIVGIDVYHAKQQRSVCGFVASCNNGLTQWYSEAIFQDKELGDAFKNPFRKALQVFQRGEGKFPTNLVVFRDGVGDGQLDHVLNHELTQFREVLVELNVNCAITFSIIQKRINARIFKDDGRNVDNPPAGTIVDSVVTRRNYYDFYLVPQSVRQGTVNPTHYVVIANEGQLKADHVQRLAYKLCHLYYNWCGTIRVPAPCQYAHKLAYLIGQYIKKIPNAEMNYRLYYL